MYTHLSKAFFFTITNDTLIKYTGSIVRSMRLFSLCMTCCQSFTAHDHVQMYYYNHIIMLTVRACILYAYTTVLDVFNAPSSYKDSILSPPFTASYIYRPPWKSKCFKINVIHCRTITVKVIRSRVYNTIIHCQETNNKSLTGDS